MQASAVVAGASPEANPEAIQEASPENSRGTR
jgi:hypothetical protein